MNSTNPRGAKPDRADLRRAAGRLKPFWPILAVGIAILPPLLVDNNYYIQLLGFVGIFSLLAIGLNLVVGICATFSLGHQAFFALGAYTSALMTTRLGVSFWLALPASGLVGALFALLIGPVMRLRGPFLAVATLAFGEIVRLVLVNWIDLTNGPNGISGIPWPEIGGYRIDTIPKFYYLILACLVFEYFVISRLIQSRVGRAMKAMRDNEQAAQASGIFVLFYKVLSFVIAAFFAGVAGSVYAHFISFVSPDAFTLKFMIEILFMIVLGGLGSVPGAILGAAIVALMPEILRPLHDVRLIVYSLLIIVILIFAPKGIWGFVDQFRLWLVRRASGRDAQAASLADAGTGVA